MARYRADHIGTRRYLMFNPELKRELHRRAILGLGVAAGLAPRRTGALASSGEVRDDGPNSGTRGDRMGFSIHFTSEHAVPGTYDRDAPDNRAYLLAAISAMERGR